MENVYLEEKLVLDISLFNFVVGENVRVRDQRHSGYPYMAAGNNLMFKRLKFMPCLTKHQNVKF
jgi:hypothetical protein